MRREGFRADFQGQLDGGISKVETVEQLKTTAAELFDHTALLLAQEYMYTEFDWRIGVLNGQALYACQYFMSRGHWQIYNHGAKGTAKSGGFRTLPVREAPAEVVKLALRATAPIGDGLYGVDIKADGQRAVIIEVNDNPNLDADYEDVIDGDAWLNVYISIRDGAGSAPPPPGVDAVTRSARAEPQREDQHSPQLTHRKGGQAIR